MHERRLPMATKSRSLGARAQGDRPGAHDLIQLVGPRPLDADMVRSQSSITTRAHSILRDGRHFSVDAPTGLIGGGRL
jgi:hypothetical protein